MSDIRQFILDYIQTEYSLPIDADVETLNYMDSGYVDSLGIIRFVVALEDAFGIEFTEEEMNDPVFKLVGMLEKTIEQKVERAK